MGISISNDKDFKDLSVTFSRCDLDRVKSLVLGMRAIKIFINHEDMMLYKQLFLLVDIELQDDEIHVTDHIYTFTFFEKISGETYSINMKYYDRVFFQNIPIIK